jgi:hypothetical protein
MAVGIIKKLYVPLDDEIGSAHRYMRKKGWVDEMKTDVSGIGKSYRGLTGDPANVINVRFRQSDVEFFEPRFILPKDHVTFRMNRYQPLNWSGPAPSRHATTAHSSPKKDGKRRSEQDRVRSAIESTVYSPRHVKLQNALFDYLCARFGQKFVNYEKGYVDLQLRQDGVQTLFEIKIAPTAKSCIRQAIGQLLEYDLYPDRKRSSKLVVVGDGPVMKNDEVYLQHLRQKFGIPISYRRWNWEQSAIEGDL